jgi:hypothetical protein
MSDRDSFGRAPDDDEQFGSAPSTPGPKPAPRPAPQPAPAAGRNVALIAGVVVVGLAILAAIVGFVMR